MDIAQWYETTLTDCDSGLAVRAVTIPAGSMAPYVRADLVGWAALLGMNTIALLDSGVEIAAVLASLLRPGDEAAAGLARAVVNDVQLPFAGEELRGAPLEAIALSAGVRYASVASLVASREHRLILVAVPAGVTVLGTAADVAGALDVGLHAGIREVMGLDGRSTDRAG